MDVATISLPAAHAGHWALWMLYAVPVLIVLGAVAVSAWRQRGERREGERVSRSPAP